MRTIGFLVVAVIGELLFGHGTGAWYAMVIVAWIVFRPFGTAPARRSTNSITSSLPSADEIASGAYVPSEHSSSGGGSGLRGASRFFGLAFLVVVAVVTVLAIVAALADHRSNQEIATTETSVGADSENRVEHVAGRVWDPSDCEEKNFPQVVHPEIAENMGMDTSAAPWRLRVAQAHAFCGHQWNRKRFAEAAERLEENGMLMPQWNADTDAKARKIIEEKFGQEIPSIYAGFPVDVANFFKVLDAGVLLVGNDDVITSMRSKTTHIPPRAVIESVRKSLHIESDYTEPSSLPQIYVVNDSAPRVRVVTDVGLGSTLREAIWQGMTAAYSNDVAHAEEFVSMMGATLTGRGNLLAAMPLMMMQMEIRQSANEREHLAALAGRPAEPLHDLDIFFLKAFPPDISESLRDRAARYDSAKGAIYVSRGDQANFAIDSFKLGITKVNDGLLPTALWHEHDHYLYDSLNAAASPFMTEGLATALGEHERRSIEAGMSVDKDDPLFKEKIRLTQALRDGSMTQEQSDEWSAKAAARIRKYPMTDIQCYYLTLTTNEYVSKGTEIPIARLLTLTPAVFQSDALGDVTMNYATSWSILHYVSIERPDRRPDLWNAALHFANTGSITDDDRKKLQVLSLETREWLRGVHNGRNQLCQSGKTNKPINVANN